MVDCIIICLRDLIKLKNYEHIDMPIKVWLKNISDLQENKLSVRIAYNFIPNLETLPRS
jgi:hypothetical protein